MRGAIRLEGRVDSSGAQGLGAFAIPVHGAFRMTANRERLVGCSVKLIRSIRMDVAYEPRYSQRRAMVAAASASG